MAFGLVGLGILTLIILSLRAITEQSHRRQQLIEARETTREELARSERRAGVLEERQRLAGEIHDTLAQAFTSIVMLLEAAHEDRERFDGATDPASRDRARPSGADVRRRHRASPAIRTALGVVYATGAT